MSKIKNISFDQFQSFVKSIQDDKNEKQKKYLAMFNCLYYYGLRISELNILRLEDVNLREKTIYITALKGGVSRSYPIVKPCIKSLQNWLIKHPGAQKNEFLFPGYSGRGMSRSNIHQLIGYYGQRAGIPKELRHAHTFRHGIAFHLLEIGWDIYRVQIWLRHKSITSTEKYTEHFNHDVNNIADSLK